MTIKLMDQILSGVTRATPNEEKSLFSTHPYYGELRDNKVYINEAKLKAEGSTGDFVNDMFFGEALHNLDKSSPKWYNRLKKAAENDPAVMRWKDESYKHDTQAMPIAGESRTKKDWWKESRFDQVIGGYLLGGKDANVHTMRDWNKDYEGFGTGFRKELEAFRKELGITPKYDLFKNMNLWNMNKKILNTAKDFGTDAASNLLEANKNFYSGVWDINKKILNTPKKIINKNKDFWGNVAKGLRSGD
jgi:hypothetical protein